MSADRRRLWGSLPEKVDHPYRVAIIEALQSIGEPLSAIEMVDVLDGYMSMWSAAFHLEALKRLGVVETVAGSKVPQAHDARFDRHYRLVNQGATKDA